MQSAVHHLSSLVADPAVFGERGLPPGVKALQDSFWDDYDNTTLIYDAVWFAPAGAVRIYTPKLLGFKPAMMAGRFLVDGQPVKLRLTQYRQYDMLTLLAPKSPESVVLRHEGHDFDIALSPAVHDRFAGRNVLYTRIRNDDLTWVRDWVLAHQRLHGADAVLIADNGSEAYTSEDIRAALSGIQGLAAADVVFAPHRNGARPNQATASGLTKFQQSAYMNLARDRWLHRARAVLVGDVDEIVAPLGAQTIFDATAQSSFKFTRFDGVWRFQAPDGGTPSHAAHTLTPEPERPCASKYCIVPDSFLGRRSWAVHSLQSLNRRVIPASRKFRFYHCRSVSTAWKNTRHTPDMTTLSEDPETTALMHRAFPDRA